MIRPAAAQTPAAPPSGDWIGLAEAAGVALSALLGDAVAAVRRGVLQDGRVSATLVEREQHACHGLAWLATYAEAVRELAAYGRRLAAEGRLGETEELLIAIGAGEYCAQVFGGIPMSQGEILRLPGMGLSASGIATRRVPAIDALIDGGNTAAHRARLVDLMRAAQGAATTGDAGLDETLEAIRAGMRKFSETEVLPHAHQWHLNNAYIPMDVVDKLAELGVFGLTLPEEFGGLGLGKVSMCVVSEELSRGYIGVGSLGTRSEIAAELILCGGTAARRTQWLPKIASGEILPTAVFTEPNTGSDLASLRTRAVRDRRHVWKVTGNKTWITHAGARRRDDRAGAHQSGCARLQGPLDAAWRPKPRGTDAKTPSRSRGLTGGEIEVLGYRGMKEYELAFDGFEVPPPTCLAAIEGQGFKQLMQTFESARIQTAARAIGVAQSALDLGLALCRGAHPVRQAADRHSRALPTSWR